ncbi:MAG TPA: hypothetical protein VGQ11_11165 [Candidatus Acidoferrales bacterium]|nr:hypothetical protein [Candidatus Acidoferrales bacterium]
MQGARVKGPLDSTKPAVLWREPEDLAARNILYGPGGPENAPRGEFRFVKEIVEGASPKFDVVDEQGVHWRVKPGDEARSETAATRLLWAVGYFADETYYVPELRVEGLKKTTLTRGGQYILEDGVIVGVRMERRSKDHKKTGSWSWFKNPFVGTRELSGLKIMMALMNNWDLKPLNNSIYEGNGEYRYLVSDVGATFGRTGEHFTRTKDNLDHYVQSKFIRKTTPEAVDFVVDSRPILLFAMFVPTYVEQTKRERVVKNIPREHARWMGQLLSRLSEQQIRDCFRAGNYSPEEIDGFTKKIQERIAQLNQL